MSEKFSLKDHLFNPKTTSQLAAEFAAAVPNFDPDKFTQTCLAGFADRELLARLDWMADQLELQLAPDFPTMAGQLLAALPAPLDPTKSDDDFGQFIHAVTGILTVRHGMGHLDLALDVLHAATQRFSMEFYIRPFLNAYPDQVMARLAVWAGDGNYHVRRLVSEGTRPKLPWAKKVTIDPHLPLPLLDQLHADPTRYVTRSVANHLNDVAKIDPDAMLDLLEGWGRQAMQSPKELAWMTRHACRTLVKQGHPRALRLLGYDPDVDVEVLELKVTPEVAHIGDQIDLSVTLQSPCKAMLIIDYLLSFTHPNGQVRSKVFKLKTLRLAADTPVTVTKRHKLKADATTFKLPKGKHSLAVQVNGKVRAQHPFELI